MESRNWSDWGFDPSQIDTLFLTHAHIDHSGRIPKLVKDGFHGKIITSPPTAELCEIMLLDSAHIQEMDAEWQSRKNKRQGKKDSLPLYNMTDAEESLKYFSPVERDVIIEVEPGIRARLRNAGHILGSSILELWVQDSNGEIKVVFSGDIGKHNQLIVKDPFEIFAADYLFIESTYGNRLHRTFEDSKNELLEAIEYSVSHGEKIMIPAFAVERTQEILYILGEFQREGKLPDIPIYLDSPLAIKATQIFRKNKKYYDQEAMAIVNHGYDPFDMPNLKFTVTSKESIAINEGEGSAIIIAGNGMCTAGRIKHHLKHNIWKPGASLVLVGFQARGTTGRKILEGAKWIKIFRENTAVRAKVFTIGGFSAHADQKDLMEWVGHFAESRPRVFVVHGEKTSSQVLGDKISKDLKLETHVPLWRESIILKAKEIEKEPPSIEDQPEDTHQLMQNTIIDLQKEIDLLTRRVKEQADKIGEDDIERLKYIQEEINSILPE